MIVAAQSRAQEFAARATQHAIEQRSRLVADGRGDVPQVRALPAAAVDDAAFLTAEPEIGCLVRQRSASPSARRRAASVERHQLRRPSEERRPVVSPTAPVVPPVTATPAHGPMLAAVAEPDANEIQELLERVASLKPELAEPRRGLERE